MLFFEDPILKGNEFRRTQRTNAAGVLHNGNPSQVLSPYYWVPLMLDSTTTKTKLNNKPGCGPDVKKQKQRQGERAEMGGRGGNVIVNCQDTLGTNEVSTSRILVNMLNDCQICNRSWKMSWNGTKGFVQTIVCHQDQTAANPDWS